MKAPAIALLAEFQPRIEVLDPGDASAVVYELFRTFYRAETHVLDTTGQVLATRGKHVAGNVGGNGLGATGVQLGSSSPKLRNMQLQEKAVEVLNFLNDKTGKSYRPVEENLRFIRARLATCSVEEAKGVIARKTRVWKNTEQAMYLRPKTLFNATNFEQYIGEREAPNA